MNRSRIIHLLALGIACLSGVVAGGGVGPEGGADLTQPEAEPLFLTEAESSGYERATPWASVVEAVDRLGTSDLVQPASLGKTHEGRDIPLLVIADPPVPMAKTRPESVGDRLVVLLFGSIHAGEVCGTDALLMLARGLIQAREAGGAPQLDDLVLLVVPIYNLDGYARWAPGHRKGQVGPALKGMRANAQGLDLNRDWLKADAPETRAMIGLLNTWDPEVIIDTHTTNGSNHRFTLTYQGPKHPAGNPDVIRYARDAMLPAIDRAFEQDSGYDAFFYGNFAQNHTKWTTYPAEPWYGVAYRGLRNRLSILTEGYAYASYEDRVRSTLAFCEQTLIYAGQHKAEISDLIQRADRHESALRSDATPLAVKTEPRAFVEPAMILGYDEPIESGAHSLRAKIDLNATPHKDYKIPVINDFVATEAVVRPAAYLVPSGSEAVIDRLRVHGIELIEIGAGAPREITAGVYRLGAVERSGRSWQNRIMMEVEVDLERAATEVNQGDILVRTDQPLGSLAAYMLEPRSTGGLAAWGFFEGLAAGDAYPITRLDEESTKRLVAEAGNGP